MGGLIKTGIVSRWYKRSEDAHPIIPVTPKKSANVTSIARIASNSGNSANDTEIRRARQANLEKLSLGSVLKSICRGHAPARG